MTNNECIVQPSRLMRITRVRSSHFVPRNVSDHANASVMTTGGIAIQSQMTVYCGVRRRFATPFISCQARRFSSSVVESFGSRALFCECREGKTRSLQ